MEGHSCSVIRGFAFLAGRWFPPFSVFTFAGVLIGRRVFLVCFDDYLSWSVFRDYSLIAPSSVVGVNSLARSGFAACCIEYSGYPAVLTRIPFTRAVST